MLAKYVASLGLSMYLVMSVLIASCMLLAANANASSVSQGSRVDEADSVPPKTTLFWSGYVSNGRVYFRIGPESIGNEFGILKRISRLPHGDSVEVAIWRRDGNELIVQSVPYSNNQDDEAEVKSWSIKFPLASVEANGDLIVDVSNLFKGADWTLSQIGVKAHVDGAPVVQSFEKNLVVTYERELAPEEEGLRRAPVVQWNFFALPDRPMRPRYLDRRTGYMHPSFSFADMMPEGKKRQLIQRWRVGERSAEQVSTDQFVPIRVQIDPGTPERWELWIRRGIESWQRAFKVAGFSKAIVAQDPNSTEGWSYGDLRNSTLCWERSDGCGWRVHDPRTGEILQAQIFGISGALKHRLAKYVVSMASVDSRVLESPISEELLGQLMQRVASHEVGHFLGLRDGSYGEFAYPIQLIRSNELLVRYGFTPSIMNYTRFNYVAQPEDEITVDLLNQQVGPADDFSIALGYANFPGSNSVEDDWMIQQSIIDLAYKNPMYRYNNQSRFFTGPDSTIDAVEVTDLVEAARLGLNNLERSINILAADGVVVAPGDEEVADLVGHEELYAAALQQWFNIIRPVGSLIGGYTVERVRDIEGRGLGDVEDIVTPVSVVLQDEAVDYICGIVNQDLPEYLIEGEFVRAAGVTRDDAVDRVSSVRRRLIVEIFQVAGINRSNLRRNIHDVPVDAADSSSDSLTRFAECVGPDYSNEVRRLFD